MRRYGDPTAKAAALLLLVLFCGAAAAQTLPNPVQKADQILKNVDKAVEQATKRAETAQERLGKTAEQVERAAKAQEQGNRAAEQGSRAAEQAARASEADHSDRAERADKAERAQHDRRDRRDGDRRGRGRDRKGDRDDDPATVRSLAEGQAQRIANLVRAHPIELEMTRGGPAVRGQVVAMDFNAAALRSAKAAGFAIVSDEVVEGLDLRTVTLRVPHGMSVDSAIALLRRIAPRAELAANHLHMQAGTVQAPRASVSAPIAQGHVAAPVLGIVDGGVARHAAIAAPVEQRGFAIGAPAPNDHGTAVASLAAGQGRLHAAFPGAPLLVADIYGRDPAGGNAMALVRALGWMVSRHVRVVAVPVSGPSNPLVARAVSIARQRGTFVVAPLGNGGPAAPPAYPASYPSVLAVTGVDRRDRIIIEAGRGPRIDYAAPGADIVAANSAGGISGVRGTSFAVPLVAGRLSRAARAGGEPLAALDREAVDLGLPGPDSIYGRGLVCADCRPRR
jgi:hypothetical protein